MEQERNILFPRSNSILSQLEAATQQGRAEAKAYLENIKKRRIVSWLNPEEEKVTPLTDSQETIRPGPSRNLNNPPIITTETEDFNNTPIITTETEDSNIVEEHTYPPRPQPELERPWEVVTRRPKRKGILFSKYSDTPFARGFIGDLGTTNPVPDSNPTPEPTIEVKRGSIMLGAKFLDDMSKADGWREDDQ